MSHLFYDFHHNNDNKTTASVDVNMSTRKLLSIFNDESSSLIIALIVVIVILALALVFLLICIIIYIKRRRASKFSSIFKGKTSNKILISFRKETFDKRIGSKLQQEQRFSLDSQRISKTFQKSFNYRTSKSKCYDDSIRKLPGSIGTVKSQSIHSILCTTHQKF